MRARSTLVLLVLALALGGYLWLVERGRPTTAERAERARRVVALAAAEVREIEIARGPADQRERTVLTRGDDGHWRLTAPLAARADDGRAAGLATEIELLEAERRVADPDRAALGLDPPRLEVRLRTADREVALALGGADPTDRQVYVAMGDQVWAVPNSIQDSLDQPVSAFRDRKALPFAPYQVARVTLAADGASTTLARRDGTWHLETPSPERADRQGVERLLERLAALEVAGFVDDPGAPPASDLAAARIVVTLEDGDERTLNLGPVADGARQARLSGEPFLVTVGDAELRGLLRPDLGLLRDRQVFHLDPTKVDRLTVSRGDRSLTVRRQGGGWTLEGSADTPAAHRIEDRIRRLVALRADRVAPQAGENATPVAAPSVVELASGDTVARVRLVAWAGSGPERKARLTRQGEHHQLELSLDESLLSTAEADVLSALAAEASEEHGPGYDHGPGHDQAHDPGH